jgi:hypothetical protein
VIHATMLHWVSEGLIADLNKVGYDVRQVELAD